MRKRYSYTKKLPLHHGLAREVPQNIIILTPKIKTTDSSTGHLKIYLVDETYSLTSTVWFYFWHGYNGINWANFQVVFFWDSLPSLAWNLNNFSNSLFLYETNYGIRRAFIRIFRNYEITFEIGFRNQHCLECIVLCADNSYHLIFRVSLHSFSLFRPVKSDIHMAKNLRIYFTFWPIGLAHFIRSTMTLFKTVHEYSGNLQLIPTWPTT